MIRIGVIGAGVMGIGIAQTIAHSKMEVVLIDVEEKILLHAMEQIENNIRLILMLNKSENQESKDTILSRVLPTLDYNVLSNVDYIIENVNENVDKKREVFGKIEKICDPDCIFIANTSCIPITHIASFTKRKELVIGVHFMNPVPLIKAVEVIPGFHTSDKTMEKTCDLTRSLGKEPIVVQDSPGFVANRVSHLFMNEAAFVLHEKLASPSDIDAIFMKCYGHKMGPLETMDLIGIDTVVNSLDVLYEQYHDPKYRCCPLLRSMVSAGMLGKKSGEGFFRYVNA